MKHIYVIGNGFDIDLGWRTSYKDFYNSKIECWRRSYFKDDELMYYVMEHAGENWYDLEKTLYDYCLDKSKSGFVTQDNAEKDFRHYESLKNQVINYVQSQSQKPEGVTRDRYLSRKSNTPPPCQYPTPKRGGECLFHDNLLASYDVNAFGEM